MPQRVYVFVKCIIYSNRERILHTASSQAEGQEACWGAIASLLPAALPSCERAHLPPPPEWPHQRGAVDLGLTRKTLTPAGSQSWKH